MTAALLSLAGGLLGMAVGALIFFPDVLLAIAREQRPRLKHHAVTVAVFAALVLGIWCASFATPGAVSSDYFQRISK